MAYDYHKKRILITQNSLSNYAGSEIVTLELATFFKNHGAEVVVFTWYYNDPIKKEFEKRDIYVTTDENNPLFDNLDLIWVHHQVLPQRFIIEKKFLGSSSPLIIFNHMSYKEDLFLEQPYIYELEKHLADKSIFVSKESLEMNLSKNKNAFVKPSVFNNLSPEEFIKNPKTPTELKKVGIVSNHPPEEIKNLLELFKAQSIDCEIIGHKNNIYDLVTPDLLKKYDCIISIGKTVQYCLTLNIPVYVYDEFGGCGYLNEKNFAKALEKNFSGRGFSKKNPQQIAQDLINNYQKALTYQTTNHAKFEKLFSFENITNLLSNISKKKKPNLDKSYLNYLISAETIAKNKVVAEYLLNLERTIFQRQINDYQNVINSMENSRAVKTAVFLRNLFHRSPPPHN